MNWCVCGAQRTAVEREILKWWRDLSLVLLLSVTDIFIAMASTSVPDPKDQFKEYQESLFKSLVAATNAANALPSDDLGFYRSLDRQFAKDLDTCGSRLLTVANNVVQHCSGDTGAEFMAVDDVDDATFRFNNVIDVVDGLLEKAVCVCEW